MSMSGLNQAESLNQARPGRPVTVQGLNMHAWIGSDLATNTNTNIKEGDPWSNRATARYRLLEPVSMRRRGGRRKMGNQDEMNQWFKLMCPLHLYYR